MIFLEQLHFSYRSGVPVLDIPQFSVPAGERLFIFGPSGSGKTTLLGLLAGVLKADSGTVSVLGENLTAMGSHARDAFRGLHLGYIFQLFNLIPYLTVQENILLPLGLSRARRARVGAHPAQEGKRLAEELGIGALLHEPVTALSVGQQQRVAAARALIGRPQLVIADEPTSALDSDRRTQFIDLLFQCCREAGSTLVFVSHDHSLEPRFDRAVDLTALNRVSRRDLA